METAEQTKKAGKGKIIIGIIVLVVMLAYFFGGGVEKQAASNMQQIENKVASDAVEQYNIAKKNGSAMDAYVQAGMVCAAYLQAKDEENYKKWKAIEKKEAKAVGMP
jgi:hypothetical protein